jgi:hypothetical protein
MLPTSLKIYCLLEHKNFLTISYYNIDIEQNEKERSAPGIEPGTSSTLKTNHTTRPSGRVLKMAHFDVIIITG